MSRQKKLIAVILAAAMVVTMLPTAAFAETAEDVPEFVLTEDEAEDAVEIILPEEMADEETEILLPEENAGETPEIILPDEVVGEASEIVPPQNEANEEEDADAADEALPEIEISVDELAELDAHLKTADSGQVREAYASGYTFHSLEDFDVDQFIADILVNNEAENTNMHLFLDAETPAEIIAKDLNNDAGFQAAMIAWKGATFDIVDYAEEVINTGGITEEQYYELVLLNMIQHAFESEEAQKLVYNSYSTDRYSNYALAAELLENVDADTVSGIIEKLKTIKLDLNAAETTEFLQEFGKQFGYLATGMDYFAGVCGNLAEFVEKTSVYQALKEFCDTSLVSTLDQMYKMCPASNPGMLMAVKKVKALCADNMEAKLIEYAQGETTKINLFFSTVLKYVLGKILGGAAFFPVEIMQAFGKLTSNISFNTDKIREQYFMLDATAQYLGLLRNTVLKAEAAVKGNNTKENARFLLDSLSLYFTAIENGCDYTLEYADALYEAKTLIGHIKKDTYQEFTNYCKSIRQSYANNHHFLLVEMWEPYLESFDPELFKEYMILEDRLEEIGVQRTLVSKISFLNTKVTWRPNSGFHYLSAIVEPADASNKSVEYSSSDTSVVEITQDGRCTAKKAGTAIITATALDGGTNPDLVPVSGSIEVEVSNGVISFRNPVGEGTMQYTQTGEDEVSVYAYAYYDPEYKTNPTLLEIPPQVTDGEKLYTVTSVAQNAFYDKYSLVNVKLPDTIRTIGYQAFRDCTNLNEINMPAELEKIDGYAFYGCDDLTTLDLPEGLTEIGTYAMNGSGLQKVTLPETLLTIGDNAFRWTALETVEIPHNVLKLGNSAFEDCHQLKDVFFSKYCYASIGEYCFRNCENITNMDLGKRISSIGKYAFAQCKALQTIWIPTTVCSIGNNPFSDCESLTNIVVYSDNPYYSSDGGVLYDKEQTTLICYPDAKTDAAFEVPDTVTTLAPQAFEDNAYLEKITLPDGLTTINTQAFSHANSLKSLSIPDSVTQMGIGICEYCEALKAVRLPAYITIVPQGSFAYCKALAKVEVPKDNDIEEIDDHAFHYCAFESFPFPKDLQQIGIEAFRNTGLKEAIIPDSVFQISHRAFAYCENLEKVHLPDSLNRLFEAAFNHTAIKEIVIPEGITAIPTSAFSENKALTKVRIPASVTSIGTSAFHNCTNLTSITLLGSQPTIGSNAFYYIKDLKIYYPAYDATYDVLPSTDTRAARRYAEALKWVPDSTNIPNIKNCSLTLSATTLTYTGKALLPEVTVAYKGTAVGTANFAVTGKNNKKPGIATITIKGKNGLKGSVTKEIKIRPKAPKISSASNSTKGITVKWNKIANATGYVVLRDNKAIKTITGNTTLKYLDTGAKTNGKVYTYKVRAYFKTSDGTKINSANSAAFKAVYMSRPSTVKLANSKAGKMTVSWNKNSKATGYQVKYVLGTTTKTTTIKSASTVSKTLSVTKGKTYKVYVRSYKTYNGTNHYSAWSAVKSLKISK